MRTQDKCAAVGAGINRACGPGVAQFAANTTQCASGALTVTDPGCAGRNAEDAGITFLLATGPETLPGAGFTADFELDTLSNGCAALEGASFAMLAGTATGIAIAPTSSSVVLTAVTPDRGTGSAEVQTIAGMTASAVVAMAVSNINGALSAVGSTVRCAMDPAVTTLVTCAVSPVTHDGGAPITVPTSFQVNDTGLGRVVVAGPADGVMSAVRFIRNEGGLSSVLSLNVVGGTTCAPCGSGANAGVCCH
jgi:hypothetical protein